MRVIILNQFFYPDHSATSQLMTDLAGGLVARGVEVTALAGRGRYNGGEKLSPSQRYNGAQIERAWTSGYGKRNVFARLADYSSFYLGAAWKLLRLPHHDIVMALTTPPLIGLVALLIGRMRGMRVIALVEDIYPDVAVAVGALRADRISTRLLDYLNRFTLRGADRIVALSECMRERIIARLGDSASSQIDVIHNWADGAELAPLGDEPNPFSIEHNLSGRFVVIFSGNLGRVNEFSTVLAAARRLRHRRDILFIFIGEGSRKVEIAIFCEQHNLDNVITLPYQPRDLLRYTLAAGHALLVTLAEGLAGLSVPSKTYSILAAGRPVLFVGDLKSGVARLVAENDCGAAVASGESERLAEIISEWASDKSQLEAVGIRARNLFDSRFDRKHAIEAYLNTFTKCLSDAPRRLRAALVARQEN